MFSHGRSLTGLIILFFVLLFIPVIGPFLAILALAAGGEALYRSPDMPTPKERQRQLAEFKRQRDEWAALSPDDRQRRLAEIERQRTRKH